MNAFEPKPTETQTAVPTAPKRPYADPRLTIHGKAADLTLGNKTGGVPDVESAGSHVSALV